MWLLRPSMLFLVLLWEGAATTGLTVNDTTHRWPLASNWSDVAVGGGTNDMVCQGSPCPSFSPMPVFPGGAGATRFGPWSRSGVGLRTGLGCSAEEGFAN